MLFKKIRKLHSNIKELSDLKERVIVLEQKERKLEVSFNRLEVRNTNTDRRLKEIKKDVRLLVDKLIS